MLRSVDPAKATILFGAGVTRAAGGPTAFDLIEAIANVLIRDRAARRWVCSNVQPRGELRFETAIEALSDVVDPDLRVLDFFESLQPGHLHHAIASAAADGTRLVTVNFDDLVERAIGDSAWTVDLQEHLNLEALTLREAVVKLHGTQCVHKGDGRIERRGSQLLQATISSIVSSGGGAGLPPAVEEYLCALISGQTLVVVGYSGSDDLDVMPSLQRCRPRRVVWLQHESGSPRQAHDRDLAPGCQTLLNGWQRVGVYVDALAGPTDQSLGLLGWQVPTPPKTAAIEAQQRAWHAYVRRWSPGAVANDPTGWAWTAELQGELGRFDLAEHSLEQSQPSTRRPGLWTSSRRAFKLAENAYLRDLPGVKVRQLAEEAIAIADSEDDGDIAASSALLILARTHRTEEPPNLEAARAGLAQATKRLQSSDALGLDADIDLERARIAIADDDYAEAAKLASRAAVNYRSAGQFSQLSESLQVRAHALTLDERHDEAVPVLAEASAIADSGPYPERQIASAATSAMLADIQGRVEDLVDSTQTAIAIAKRTKHTPEIAQMYAYLGLARIEQGRFADAARAFEFGIGEISPSTRDFLDLLVRGLLTSLLGLRQHSTAKRLLEKHQTLLESDARQWTYVRLLKWVIGQQCGEPVEWDDTIIDDAPFTGEMAFSMASLAPPTDRVRSYLDSVAKYLRHIGQVERVMRLEVARRTER